MVIVGAFAEIGEIKEVGAGYTFFWSGRKTEERREAGVGFAIKSDLVGKLTGLPNGINDRLMTLRLPLSGNKHATIVVRKYEREIGSSETQAKISLRLFEPAWEIVERSSVYYLIHLFHFVPVKVILGNLNIYGFQLMDSTL